MNIAKKRNALMIIVALVLLSVGGFSTVAYGGDGNSNNYSNFKQSAYDIGYSYGRADAQVRRSKDYKRYKNLYNGSTKNDFKRGYNLGYSENYGNNNGGNGGYGNPGYGNGGYNSSVPNWMIGTFRGYTSGNNTYTQITVTQNGYVTIAAENGSGNANGTYSNGLVSFPWGTYKFKKEGNGFRAINTSNSSDRVLYRRY